MHATKRYFTLLLSSTILLACASPSEEDEVTSGSAIGANERLVQELVNVPSKAPQETGADHLRAALVRDSDHDFIVFTAEDKAKKPLYEVVIRKGESRFNVRSVDATEGATTNAAHHLVLKNIEIDPEALRQDLLVAAEAIKALDSGKRIATTGVHIASDDKQAQGGSCAGAIGAAIIAAIGGVTIGFVTGVSCGPGMLMSFGSSSLLCVAGNFLTVGAGLTVTLAGAKAIESCGSK